MIRTKVGSDDPYKWGSDVTWYSLLEGGRLSRMKRTSPLCLHKTVHERIVEKEGLGLLDFLVDATHHFVRPEIALMKTTLTITIPVTLEHS